MAFLFVLVVVFFHLLNLQFRAFLEMGIDGGRNRAISSMSCPKADDFTTNSTFLRTRDKGMSKVVQMVVWKYAFEMFRQRVSETALIASMSIKGKTCFNIGEIGMLRLFSFIPLRCFAVITETHCSSTVKVASSERRKPVYKIKAYA